MLSYHFPDLYRAILERYQTYQRAEKQALRSQLELALAVAEEPVPSLQEIAQRFGHSAESLRKLFPELCRRISARYLGAEKVRAAQKLEQLQIEIRQATFEIWQNGLYPTRYRVASQVSESICFLRPESEATWREALHELGLSE